MNVERVGRLYLAERVKFRLGICRDVFERKISHLFVVTVQLSKKYAEGQSFSCCMDGEA